MFKLSCCNRGVFYEEKVVIFEYEIEIIDCELMIWFEIEIIFIILII